MKNILDLLEKDFIVHKKNIVVSLLYGILSLLGIRLFGVKLLSVDIIFNLTLVFTIFVFWIYYLLENKNHSVNLLISASYTRQDIIKERYFAFGITLLLSFMCNLIFFVMLYFDTFNFNFADFIMDLFLLWIFLLLVVPFSLCVKMSFFSLGSGIAFLVAFQTHKEINYFLQMHNTLLVFGICVIISILSMIISILMSRMFYMKKDL